MSDGAEDLGTEAALPTLDGRYELRKELGRGSTGTVWEAHDSLTSGSVAVKVVHAQLLGSATARKRFLREVQSASALRHPHTVRVVAHGETPDGSGYLVMERLFGATLGARLREIGALPQLRAIKIAAQILDAAGAAHRLQIVHRDLKPGNVMLVEEDGDPDFVKVCDFGLAKAIDLEDMASDGADDGAVERGSGTTEMGEICGTPEYMAPEQVRGEAVDARADLYAVGVMLFQAVVGKLPFSGRTALAVVSQQLSIPPPRPSVLRPDLRIFPPLEKLILRALAKDRAERPSSADVFRADLLQIERDLAREQQRVRKRGVRRVSSPDADTLPRAPGARPGIRVWRPLMFGAPAIVVASAIALWAGSRRGVPVETVVVKDGRAGPGLADRSGVVPSSKPPDGIAASETPGAPAAAATGQVGPPRVEPAATAVAMPPAPRKPPRKPPQSPTQKPTVDHGVETDRVLASAEDLLSGGRIVDACALGQSVAASAPASASVWEFLGRCYMRLGQPAQARAAYRRYLTLEPDGPNAVFIRAIVERDGR